MQSCEPGINMSIWLASASDASEWRLSW